MNNSEELAVIMKKWRLRTGDVAKLVFVKPATSRAWAGNYGANIPKGYLELLKLKTEGSNLDELNKHLS